MEPNSSGYGCMYGYDAMGMDKRGVSPALHTYGANQCAGFTYLPTVLDIRGQFNCLCNWSNYSISVRSYY